MMLGFFLGPVGVIAALGADSRRQCPRCMGRLEGKAECCQWRNAWLFWSGEKPRVMPEPNRHP